MGIIKRQAVQSTVFVYIGVVIGFFNSAILMPNLLDPDLKGVLDIFNSLTSIFAAVATIGLPFVTLKIFPKFRDENRKHNSYFSLILLVSVIGFLLGIIVFYIFKNALLGEKNMSREFPIFFTFFIIAYGARLLFIQFDTYVRLLYKTVIGVLLTNIVVKATIALSMLAYAHYLFSFEKLFLLYTIAISLSGLIIVAYVFSKIKIGLNWNTFLKHARPNFKEMKNLALFGLIGSLGSIVVMHVDRIMLGNMIGANATGIYTTAFFFGLFIGKPSVGLRKVSGVVITDAWKNNDLKVIKDVYYKSCINQFIISTFLFLAIWLSIDFMYDLIRPEYRAGKYVVLFIGIAQVIEMATGTNVEILATSKYYKYNTYFISILLVLVILLNYILIPIIGINGAAIASLAAIATNNFLRYIFLYRKYKLQPFNRQFLIVIAIGLAIYLILTFFIPSIPNEEINKFISLVNVGIVGSIITLLFWPIIYFLKISPEINLMIDKTIKRFKP